MFDKLGPESVSDVEKGWEWTKDSKFSFPKDGTFDRDHLGNLRRKLEAKDKRTAKEVNWKTFMDWMQEW